MYEVTLKFKINTEDYYDVTNSTKSVRDLVLDMLSGEADWPDELDEALQSKNNEIASVEIKSI